MGRLKEGDAVLAMDPRVRRSPVAIMAAERTLRLAKERGSVEKGPAINEDACMRKDFRDIQLLSAAASATSRVSKGERIVSDFSWIF